MKGMDLTRKIYSVNFQNTRWKSWAPQRTSAALTRALDAATTALAAEMVGGMQRTLELTVAYAKTRKQFGKPIGTFQAVQHMCADMYLETESAPPQLLRRVAREETHRCTPVAFPGLRCTRSDDCPHRRQIAGYKFTAAWASLGRTICISTTGRAKASETMLGDATFHRERIARLVIDGAVSAASEPEPAQELAARR